jgi:hypothetical protein
MAAIGESSDETCPSKNFTKVADEAGPLSPTSNAGDWHRQSHVQPPFLAHEQMQPHPPQSIEIEQEPSFVVHEQAEPYAVPWSTKASVTTINAFTVRFINASVKI